MIKPIQFPELTQANRDGLLAMGGELNPDWLVSAYSQGIFPWFSQGQPILWWSPDPRMVLFPDKVHVSRSLRKVIKQKQFSVTCNQNFAEVISNCAMRGATSKQDDGTWITDEMNQAYQELHKLNYAHSIEVWQHGELVGGLYGIALGKVFFGESMFSHKSNASKVALVALCQYLITRGYKIVDCQVTSDHLLSLGAEEIPRTKFAEYLQGINIQQADIEFTDKFDTLTSLK